MKLSWGLHGPHAVNKEHQRTDGPYLSPQQAWRDALSAKARFANSLQCGRPAGYPDCRSSKMKSRALAVPWVLLAMLAGCSAGAMVRETDGSYRPLAFWLEDFTNMTAPLTANLQKHLGLRKRKCIVVQACYWGLGSNLQNIWFDLMLLKQLPFPKDFTIYYDHSTSPYQCINNSLQGLLHPSPDLVQMGAPQQCGVLEFNKAKRVARSAVRPSFEALKNIWCGKMPQEDSMQDNIPARQHLLRNSIMESMCPVVLGFWRLAPEVAAQLARAQQQVQGWAAATGKAVIALQARGGDKRLELKEKEVDEDDHYIMVPGMHQVVESYPFVKNNSVCIIVGDDSDYAALIERQAREVLGCDPVLMRSPSQPNTSHHQQTFRKKSLAERCEASKQYLVDVELLAWSDIMIGMSRSNVAHLAALLRQCKYYRPDNTIFDGKHRKFKLWHSGTWVASRCES